MSILPDRSATNFTPAGPAVSHPSWCDSAGCMATPDWDADGTGFVAHHARLLDVDGLIVEVAQGETISPQGDVLEREPIVVRVDAVPDEMATGQAGQLTDALVRAAAVAGGAR